LSAAFGMTILDSTSRVHFAPFVIELPNSLNIPHSPAVFDQS
jgi:hypothetical protein